MDWRKHDLNVNKLIKNGYRPKTLFFSTGGGEDEDNMDYFVKGGIAVSHSFTYDKWFSCKEDNLSYTNGWDYDNQEYFDITSLDS